MPSRYLERIRKKARELPRKQVLSLFGLRETQLRRILNFNPKTAPACCKDSDEYLLWKIADFRFENTFCADCTPFYQARMWKAGKCEHPHIGFVYSPIRESLGAETGELVEHELTGTRRIEGFTYYHCTDLSPDVPMFAMLPKLPKRHEEGARQVTIFDVYKNSRKVQHEYNKCAD